MAKTVYNDNTDSTVYAAWFNGMAEHTHDGTDFDGHAPKVDLAQHTTGQLPVDNAEEITALIIAESSSRGYADTAEEQARIAADTAETNARIAAVSAEANARINADASLGNGIKNHTHTGGAGVPGKIDLTAHVSGQLPWTNIVCSSGSIVGTFAAPYYQLINQQRAFTWVNMNGLIVLNIPDSIFQNSASVELQITGNFSAITPATTKRIQCLVYNCNLDGSSSYVVIGAIVVQTDRIIVHTSNVNGWPINATNFYIGSSKYKGIVGQTVMYSLV